MRIKYVPGTGYHYQNKTFKSLLDIINLLRKDMKIPVTGSKYERIFINYGEHMHDYLTSILLYPGDSV
jgi:hypothetical protein